MRSDSRFDSLFRPPAERWERLSPKYTVVKLISIFIAWPILFGVVLAVVWFATSRDWDGRTPLLVGIAVTGVVILAWRAIRAPLAVRRWGYAERDEDVYLTRGLLSRSLTCVPYGRMQLVEVNSGPVERLFGLATVSMVTASSGGAVTIPGLDLDDAEAIRDRFINRGKHLRAGI